MYSWCDKETWYDDFLDFDWCFSAHGKYETHEEALEEARKHIDNEADIVIFYWGD